MTTRFDFDVFGRLVSVQLRDHGWIAFDLVGDGKLRPAEDIRVPSDLGQDELATYLADLCHEQATPERSEVIVLPVPRLRASGS